MTAALIEDAIIRLINNFEPRARLIKVTVTVDYDNNGFGVEVQYIVVNTETPATFNLFLERIR
jgi:predicted component of type VI protein secretion system